MAFLTVEDRIAEIEVIVFAKQYSKVFGELFEENAVIIEGKLTFDEGESPEIILSKLEPLLSNSAFSALASGAAAKNAEVQKSNTDKVRIFIRMDRFEESRLAPIYRLSTLNPGKAEVAVFDASSGKYISIKNITLSTEDKVVNRLKSLFGDGNVVVK